MLFLDQPPDSYSQRVKPESNNLTSSKMAYLKMTMDMVLEEEDFIEFSNLINRVIEFHEYYAYLLY